MVHANPFAQAEHYTQISFTTNRTLAHQAEAYFDDMALSMSVFEVDEVLETWQVDIVTDTEINKQDIAHRLELLVNAAGGHVPTVDYLEVTPDMWQHNLHQFPPLYIGRYLIHGSHINPERKHQPYPICVDAGMAFGSGEHATTEGCLKLFDAYIHTIAAAWQKRRYRVLDIGCGSAILAMAAVKRLAVADIVGVDIDKVSVQVAKNNAKINGVSRQVKLYHGNGYSLRAVQSGAPYDVVFANILAKPLMQMASQLACVLDRRGVAILSGLLNTQEAMVLGAHRLVGLHLKRRWRKDGWSALLLEKQ